MFRRLAFLAAILAAATLHAEGVRSSLATPSAMAYIETATVGAGPDAEAVDLTALADFPDENRTFCVIIENESASDDLLVQFSTDASVTASELTTPADATLGNVVRITGASDANQDLRHLRMCGQFTGWIWQSVGSTLVDANATVTY